MVQNWHKCLDSACSRHSEFIQLRNTGLFLGCLSRAMTFSVANCSSPFPDWLHRRGAWSKAHWNPAPQSWGGSSSLGASSTPQPYQCRGSFPFLEFQSFFLLITEAAHPHSPEVMSRERSSLKWSGLEYTPFRAWSTTLGSLKDSRVGLWRTP